MRRDGKYIVQRYPDNAFYLVKELIDEMNNQQVTARDMCKKVGCEPSTITKWKYQRRPNIDSLRACFNVLGYDLTIKKIYEKRDETNS